MTSVKTRVFLLAFGGVLVLFDVFLWLRGQYRLAIPLLAFCLTLPALIVFEWRRSGARELAAIAVMTGISVVGRVLFAPLPGFKPVSAVVILTGLSFGPLAGFMTGAATALLSNFFFGQGPWTAFQMLAWGAVGFLSGLFARSRLRRNPLLLLLLGVIGGALFSALTDLWTTVAATGTLLPAAYLTFLVSGLPFTLLYAVSNVLFLLLLTRPILRKTDRLKQKYGLFA
ncbi:MAG: ECF transporter S component [Clostridia bacterium]|nr:ECF transporter S component [Clostridia bacterium]